MAQERGERDTVRLAALRALLRAAAERWEPWPMNPTEEQVARLLLSGRDVPDICNALGLPPAAVHAMLVDLAR